MTWKNTTSYSQSEDKSEVRTTSFALDALTVTVTRYIGMGEELVMHCRELHINSKPLNTTDMKEGQEKAISIVISLLRNKVSTLQNSLKTLESSLENPGAIE